MAAKQEGIVARKKQKGRKKSRPFMSNGKPEWGFR